MTTVRPELPSDQAVIRQLTDAAFASMPFSDGLEGAAIDGLRADGDLILSLVAEGAEGVVGHIAFSPVALDGRHDGWFGLGPVAVRPDKQRQGIGGQLIWTGLGILADNGAAGVVLTGSPGYYSRFGFANDPGLSHLDTPAQFVLRLVLNGPVRSGAITFAPALNGV